MSESLDGFSVAATRQNAGSCLNAAVCCAAADAAPGGENAPAATGAAAAIFASGNASDATASQLEAAVSAASIDRVVPRTAHATPARSPAVRRRVVDMMSLLRRGADEVGRIVGAACAFVLRELWIGAQRPRHRSEPASAGIAGC